jgi:HlyD family secretion protein
VDGIVVARNVEVGQTVAASFATPNLFLIALDLTKMQVDTNVSESDIGGITEGKDASFTVDAYPGTRFSGSIRQVRLAPINVQNVVTYNVVVAVDNQDLRLKPGMTANVSIIVAQKDQALKVPNAALRFTPPPSADIARAEATTPTGGPDALRVARGAEGQGAGQTKQVWRLAPGGELEPVALQVGISDGVATEVLSGPLNDGEHVVVGIETSRAEKRSSDLPPGFGSGQRRSRDRGL